MSWDETIAHPRCYNCFSPFVYTLDDVKPGLCLRCSDVAAHSYFTTMFALEFECYVCCSKEVERLTGGCRLCKRCRSTFSTIEIS